MATAAQTIIDQIDAAIASGGTDGLTSITFSDGRSKQFDWSQLIKLREHYATKDRGSQAVPFGMAKAKSGGVI